MDGIENEVMVKLFIDPFFFATDNSTVNSQESGSLSCYPDSVYDDLRREISIVSSLFHSNIVIYYDEISGNGLLGSVMEYCPRGNLHDFIVKNGPMQEAEIKKVLFQMLQVLAYLAESRIVHRDIKTANILIVKEGSYKMCDFGSSVLLDVPSIPFRHP